jgi:hypothetical protein
MFHFLRNLSDMLCRVAALFACIVSKRLRHFLAGIVLRWHWIKIDVRDCFRIKAKPRKGGIHGFRVGAAVVGSHLSIMELEPRVMLAADFDVLGYAVYDFGDVQVRDLGINDHVPVLVGDMWDSVEERQVGRVLMGDGNGGFTEMEVGSLGDGDTFVISVSANGLYFGGASDSPSSEAFGQGFVTSLTDPMSLVAVDYLYTNGPLSTNPVDAIGDTGRTFGNANGFVILYESDLSGVATPLSDGLNVTQLNDSDVSGELQAGFISEFDGIEILRPLLRSDNGGMT